MKKGHSADQVLFASDAFALAGVDEVDYIEDAAEFHDFKMGAVLNGDGRFHQPGRHQWDGWAANHHSCD